MRNLTLILVLCCAVPALATTRYVAQTAGTFSGGVNCNGQTAITPATWNSTSESAGDITYVCGTITSSTNGGNAFTFSWSGTSANPLTLYFDTGASLQSSGWWGNASSAGAITVNGYNYIVINGQNTGVIENTLAGCVEGVTGLCDGSVSATCPGGTCSKSPGATGSTGVFLANASHVIVENLTIQNIYVNAGSTSSATDTSGASTAGIFEAGNIGPISLINNTINNASIGIAKGITGQSGSPQTPSGCPLTVTGATMSNTGNCDGFNTITQTHWMISNGGTGAGTFNEYNNTLNTVTLWQYPTGTYHTDGIITYGGASTVVTDNIWNNTFSGDLGNGSATAFIYCTSDGGSDGSGSDCNIYNNLFLGDAVLNSLVGVGSYSGDASGQTDTIYNNTFENAGYDLYVFNGSGAPNHTLTFTNNIAVGNTSTYFYVLNGNPLTSSDNDFWSGRSSGAWNGSSPLATWQASCSCDAGSQFANPNLNGSYVPNSGSPAIGLGANLTSLGITTLNSDKTGNPRPSSGAWTVGAFNSSSSPSAPKAPFLSVLSLNP